MSAALILETSAFGRVGSSSTRQVRLGTTIFTCTGSQAVEGIGLQIRQGNLTRVRFSPCAPFFSFYASVAHLERAPGYEPGGGKFESFQTHHFSVQANRMYTAGC